MFLQFDLTRPGCPTVSIHAVFAWGNRVSGSWRLMNDEFVNLLAWDDRGTFNLIPDAHGAYIECFDRYSSSPAKTYGGEVPNYGLDGVRFILSNAPHGPDDEKRKHGPLEIVGSRNPAGWTGRPFAMKNGQPCLTENEASWTRLR